MYRLIRLTMLLFVFVFQITPAAAAGPELAITAPTNGMTIQGNSVKVEFKASNLKIIPSTVALADYGKRPEANRPDEGHLHLTLDLWPLVVWEKQDAYTFTNVPPGEHQLKVELVNNDHSLREPAIVQVVHFRTEGAAPLPATMPRTGVAEGEQPYIVLMISALLLLVAGWALRRRQV